MIPPLRDRCAHARYDAVVIGAGPNGLAAAITLAQSGASVLLLEAGPDVGGACRTRPLTLPGFRHDVGSSIHPLGFGSPFFRSLRLERYGLEWIHPEVPMAHPLDGGRRTEAILLQRSVVATTAGFDPDDAAAYRRLFEPLLAADAAPIATISELTLARGAPSSADLLSFPYPALAATGLLAARSARGAANHLFHGSRARALFAGLAAHANMPLESPPGAGIALALAVCGHAFGWPFPRGGSQNLADALAACLRDLGGEILCDATVTSLTELPPSDLILCDITPRQFLRIAGDTLPASYQSQLRRYRYGPAAYKVDWALDGPIPWRDEIADDCRRTATVHLGGAFAEIADAERAVAHGQNPARPFVLVAQHSLLDDTRAPAGAHTAWGYCHVPLDSTKDRTDAIESQIERFAPGFRKRILARTVHGPRQLEAFDPNLVGGDIGGGSMDGAQILARPIACLNPYRTPLPGVYLCSSSTPPGGGVHGMCGYWAARSALRGEKRRLGLTD